MTFNDPDNAFEHFLPQPNAHGERIVRFEKHTDLDLPSPELLEIHAVLAKILHASGMGEYIEKVIQDRSEIGHFATDGSTDIRRLLFVF